MSVKINVWYPKGDNVGHASIEFHGTYMSWWPSSENPGKLKMVKMVFAGGPGSAPTFADDKSSEGREPSWTGDYFGWDNDDKAIEYWKKVYFSDMQKGISAMRAGNKDAQYCFVSNNCCDVVDQLLVQAGAYSWQVKLNLWRGMKIKLAPRDIATIGAYLGGQTSLLNDPRAWFPAPDLTKET